jgi:hypothetical protein
VQRPSSPLLAGHHPIVSQSPPESPFTLLLLRGLPFSPYHRAHLDLPSFDYSYVACYSHCLTTSACQGQPIVWRICLPTALRLPICQVPARGRSCRFSRQPTLCDVDNLIIPSTRPKGAGNALPNLPWPKTPSQRHMRPLSGKFRPTVREQIVSP